MVIETYAINEDDYDWFQPQTVLEEFCLGEEVYCLNLAQAFNEYGQKEPLYFDIDPHWNEKGHLLGSEEIFNFLKKNKMAGIQ